MLALAIQRFDLAHVLPGPARRGKSQLRALDLFKRLSRPAEKRCITSGFSHDLVRQSWDLAGGLVQQPLVVASLPRGISGRFGTLPIPKERLSSASQMMV